jgi:hypothetical protein
MALNARIRIDELIEREQAYAKHPPPESITSEEEDIELDIPGNQCLQYHTTLTSSPFILAQNQQSSLVQGWRHLGIDEQRFHIP